MAHIKTKIQNNENVMGAFINFFAPPLVDMAGYAGFDFVIIDDEHGAFSSTELEHMIRAAESVGIDPVIRVSYNTASIQKALDRGAAGIQVPMVSNGNEARQVVNSVKYPPIGRRGVAYSIRPAQFGVRKGTRYLEQENDNILITVQIETPEAVENFQDILETPGIDIAFVGRVDLSVNMGYRDNPYHYKVNETIQQLYELSQGYKVAMGTVANDCESSNQAFTSGARYVGVVINSIIMNNLKTLIDKTEKS